MAYINGSIPISGFIAPTDDADTFATQDEAYNRGGYRSVPDTIARDGITPDRRKEGMLVFIISTDVTYQLKGGILNTNWVEYSTGSSGGSGSGEVIDCGERLGSGGAIIDCGTRI